MACLFVNSFLRISAGSDDTSVRVWSLSKATQQPRRVLHICTLAGHSASIRCVDISSAFSLVVSGGMDQIVCVWDFRLKRLLRVLSDHKGPVLSVSINPISGQIATLTSAQIRLYTINGELLSYVDVSSIEGMPPPTVVLATPCDIWQEGVEIVSGHKDGHVHVWKMSKHEALAKSSRKYDRSRAYSTVTNRARLRELYVSCTPMKTHKADITVLRLCSSAAGRAKEIVTKSFDESRSLDLLVGDEDGFVSRWAATKLEQLPAQDLGAVLKADGNSNAIVL